MGSVPLSEALIVTAVSCLLVFFLYTNSRVRVRRILQIVRPPLDPIINDDPHHLQNWVEVDTDGPAPRNPPPEDFPRARHASGAPPPDGANVPANEPEVDDTYAAAAFAALDRDLALLSVRPPKVAVRRCAS